jgi:hypothetical protein
MNLNIVKYLGIIWIYVNIIMWIWILYEFESYMNLNPVWIWILYEFESCINLNLKYSNMVVICIFQMVLAALS